LLLFGSVLAFALFRYIFQHQTVFVDFALSVQDRRDLHPHPESRTIALVTKEFAASAHAPFNPAFKET
jgi:hypothetical protein